MKRQASGTAAAPHLFLLDDDPVFCRLMQKVARRAEVPLSICSRLSELGTSPRHREFDVAVIDYYLEDLTGTEIACLLEDKPVLLVSRSEGVDREERDWPSCIKRFVPKQQGPEAILRAAMELTNQRGDEP